MSVLSPRTQRILGALLGVHAGDSFGATYEFTPWQNMHSRYGAELPREIRGGGPFGWSPGHATDDTDMTRAVLLAYLDRLNDPTIDIAKTAGTHMLDWLHGRDWPDREQDSSPVDVGNATRIGLHKFSDSLDPAQAGAGNGQAGNGSLMRCIPTALFEEDEKKLESDSVRISAITHDDQRCTVSCAAYNVIVRALVDGKQPLEAVEEGLEVARSIEASDDNVDGKPGPVQQAIELGMEIKVSDLADSGPRPHLPGNAGGFVLESLTIAVSAVLDERSFVDVLVDVVRIGRDTDTNGAIAGGILGARDGIDSIPEDWVNKLQFGDEFKTAAQLLVEGPQNEQ